MPPPKSPRDSVVAWPRLEARLGLRFPGHFKEFVATYGASTWMDHLTLVYSAAKTDRALATFQGILNGKLRQMEAPAFDKDWNEVDLKLYPERGGLYPYMIDFSGGIYCWKASTADPDRWSTHAWIRGQVVKLGKYTLAGMLLDWLERKPKMKDLWGDIRDLPAERLRLS